MTTNHQEILDFWFGPENAPDHGRQRKCWFVKDSAFDDQIRHRFLTTWEAAARGELDGWCATPGGALALIILLDQFPRNLFRNDARAFSSDEAALRCALHAIGEGFDRELLPAQRMFVYLPLEHSERPDMQALSVHYFSALARDHPEFVEALDYALRHRDIIQRFGRYPHRNAALGRPSTAEEIEFLKQPGSSF